MPATSRERVRSIDPFIWIVAGLTLLARALTWAAGLHVDLSPIGPKANQHAWQLLDLNLLRHDLLSASGSLIMQPPLYNVAVGTLLHLPAHLQAPVAGIGLLVSSLVISLATYSTMTLLGVARGVALAVTVVLVVADPASLLFSSSLFYAAPAAALVTATAWAAVRLFERPSGSRAGLFGAIAATLALTNTSYQPVMVLLVFVFRKSEFAPRGVMVLFGIISFVLVWAKEYRQDSGGAGEFRGGLGQVMEIETAEEMPFAISSSYDRVVFPPRGRLGGLNGMTGRIEAVHAGKQLPPKASSSIPVGERLRISMPGGGGYGDPHKRPAERVADDVERGLVSKQSARDHYGVALKADGSVDAAETAKLRTKVAAE